MNRIRFVLGAAAAALALAAAGCGKPATGAKAGGFAKGPRPYSVRTTVALSQPLNYYIETTGTLRAQDVYRIDAQVAGVLQDVAFNEGDVVTPEKVLARISPELYELGVVKAEAALKRAEADLKDTERRLTNDVREGEINLESARIEFERRRTVRAAGAISEEEVQLFESKHEMAKVQLEDMRQQIQTLLAVLRAGILEKQADLQQAEVNRKKSIVRAPLGGTIEQRSVSAGQHVPAGQSLALLVDHSRMRLQFTLPEREASHVKTGSTLTFRVPGYPGRDFSAKVYRIGDLADPMARTVVGWAHVEANDAELKAGFFASVKIVSDAKLSAVIVPQTAVLPTEYGFVVYVLNGTKAERRGVKLGLHVTDDSVEILEGLKSGDRIVVEGANALQDGVEVKILDGAGTDGKSGEGKRESKSEEGKNS